MRTSTVLPVALVLLVPVLASCGQPEDVATAPAGVTQQYSTLEAEVAERGRSVTSGEWKVSYIVESAEPWFQGHAGHQQFRAPASAETHHIEIIPTETSTGRIVPDVPVNVQVVDEKGAVVDEQRLNFYYSTFFHYANNFSVPADGSYTLRATLGAPTFLRHGEESEQPALTEGATVTFEDVELTREG